MAEVPSIFVLDKDSVSREIATITKLMSSFGLPADAKTVNPDLTTATLLALAKGLLQKLVDIHGAVDGLEGYVDGLETLIGTSNTALATLQGYLDLVETKLDTLNASIVAATIATGLKTGANSLSVVRATDQGANPVSLETSTIFNGAAALVPKFAPIAAATSGNNTLVAAVTSKKIRVLAYNFIANGTVNAKFQTGAGGTDISGLKYCVANSGIVAPFNPLGWFETAAGALLNLNLSAAVAVGGELVYAEV